MCPGRRSDRHRPGRARLPLRRRAAQARALRDRLGGDGQRRAEHERQPVLRRERPSGVGLPPQYSLFGKVVKGLEVLSEMESVTTDRNDRPQTDVVIQSVTVTEAD